MLRRLQRQFGNRNILSRREFRIFLEGISGTGKIFQVVRVRVRVREKIFEVVRVRVRVRENILVRVRVRVREFVLEFCNSNLQLRRDEDEHLHARDT